MAQEHHGNRLVEAYERMLERVRQLLSTVGHEAGPAVNSAIETAQRTATELGELTREEAERVAYYVRHDLHDLAESGKDLGDWLRFDTELVERSLADLFLSVADRTKVELERFALEAEAFGEWRSGEVAAPGTLECKSCGRHIVLVRTGHIPPCPSCGGTTFRRFSLEE